MRTPPAPEPRYLELRLRRPASAWPLARLASVAGAIALFVVLLIRPDEGLFVFWQLVVPLLPLVFLVAPGLWRNVCPMAAVNQLPRVLGITRGLRLPGWLEHHGYGVGLLVFLAVVASRPLLFDSSAQAVAVLIGTVLGVALIGGLAFRGKSGFCGSVCPLRPVQGLYGQEPIAVQTSHCRPCVGCVSNCPDLLPKDFYRDDLQSEAGRPGRYRRLLAGALPGFILAIYTLGEASPATTYLRVALFMLASLGSFFLLESLSRGRVERVAALYAAVSFGLFYWFNVPVLGDAIARLAGGAPPAWAIWEGRALAIALGAGWLVRSLRRERAAEARAPRVFPLPMAGPTVPAEAGELPETTPSDTVPPAPPRQRPVAGDPPVPVPDRRSKGRRMRHPQVTFMPQGRELQVAPGSTLLQAAQGMGLDFVAGCRMGVCGSDPIFVHSGVESLSPPSDDEQATILRLGLPDHARMACCARVLGDVVVSLDPVLADDEDPEPREVVLEAAADPVSDGSPANRTAVSGGGIARVVIIGNGIAGVTAADHVRRHHAECEIELVSDERHPFYNRTGVSRLISSRDGVHRMYLLPEAWYEERRIVSWLNTRARAIDTGSRTVELGTGDSLRYDRLILATGSSPVVPAIEGVDLDGSFTLRAADDAMLIRAFAQRDDCRRAVVVGGGVLGLEAADMLRKLGLDVTVVEREGWLAGSQLDERGGEILRSRMEERGVEVLLETGVTSLLGNGRVNAVELAGGDSRPAELVLVCAGVAPNVGLAREAGLDVGAGVRVDDLMRTSDPAIFAAGDVAEHAGRVYGLWPAAVEQAELAAINALGARRPYAGSIVPTHLKVAGVDLTSIGRPQAQPGSDQEIALEEPETRRYRKLVLSEGRVVGAVLLGYAAEAAAVLAAVRERRDVRRDIASLQSGDWHVLSESHFEQAVVAPLTRHRSGGAPAEEPRASAAGS
jgi:nitrite reductase (NADH) large subunit